MVARERIDMTKYRHWLHTLDAEERKDFIAYNGGYVAILTFVARAMDNNPSPTTKDIRDLLDQAIQCIDDLLKERAGKP